MLLVFTLLGFVSALVLFVVAFDRFMGSSDTPEVAAAMRQINQADVDASDDSSPAKTFAASA